MSLYGVIGHHVTGSIASVEASKSRRRGLPLTSLAQSLYDGYSTWERRRFQEAESVVQASVYSKLARNYITRRKMYSLSYY